MEQDRQEAPEGPDPSKWIMAALVGVGAVVALQTCSAFDQIDRFNASLKAEHAVGNERIVANLIDYYLQGRIELGVQMEDGRTVPVKGFDYGRYARTHDRLVLVVEAPDLEQPRQRLRCRYDIPGEFLTATIARLERARLGQYETVPQETGLSVATLAYDLCRTERGKVERIQPRSSIESHTRFARQMTMPPPALTVPDSKITWTELAARLAPETVGRERP